MRSSVPKPVWNVLILLGLLTAVMALGTVGFQMIEGHGWFNSFYMALITLTTVGYEETIKLSEAGRLFNAFLILTGFSVVFTVFGILSHTLLKLELVNFFEERKMKKIIHNLSDHYIVCGLGRVGRGVIQQLQRGGAKVIAIDKSAEFVSWAQEHEVPVLTEDATLDATLEHAGARRASGLVAAISSDAENVYVTLSARVLNPDLRIVARAADEGARSKLLRAGAHVVFTPYSYTGYRLAEALLRPQVSHFLDIASAIEEVNTDLNLEEYHVTEESLCHNRTLAESELGKKLDIVVLALSKPGQSLRFNPPPTTRMEAGDVLIVMGRRTTLYRMQRALEK